MILRFREANKKLQKLFPFVKVAAKKYEGVHKHINQ